VWKRAAADQDQGDEKQAESIDLIWSLHSSILPASASLSKKPAPLMGMKYPAKDSSSLKNLNEPKGGPCFFMREHIPKENPQECAVV
jgi:hypothetical protein